MICRWAVIDQNLVSSCCLAFRPAIVSYSSITAQLFWLFSIIYISRASWITAQLLWLLSIIFDNSSIILKIIWTVQSLWLFSIMLDQLFWLFSIIFDNTSIIWIILTIIQSLLFNTNPYLVVVKELLLLQVIDNWFDHYHLPLEILFNTFSWLVERHKFKMISVNIGKKYFTVDMFLWSFEE